MANTSVSIQLINVSIEVVAGLVQAIHAEPTQAATTWRASVGWEGDFRTSTQIREFGPCPTAQTTALGRHDAASNPVEQVLGALGTCTATGYAANATAGIGEIKDLRIDLEGDLDLREFLHLADSNAGHQAVRARVRIDVDADQATSADLHNRVVTTSPKGNTLTRSGAISSLDSVVRRADRAVGSGI